VLPAKVLPSMLMVVPESARAVRGRRSMVASAMRDFIFKGNAGVPCDQGFRSCAGGWLTRRLKSVVINDICGCLG
jgi:hypothetical protein